MSKITRVPRGLQKYLGTQNQGENPVDLAQIVSPGLSMDRFYDVENDFWQAYAFSPTAIATTFAIKTIPNDEIWIAKNFGLELTFAGATSGDTCRAQIVVQSMPNQSLVGNIPIASFGTLAFDQDIIRVANDAGGSQKMLWGGSTLRGYISDVNLTAGSIAGWMWINYIRLKY